MKKYFVYELKNSLFAIGCITLVATLIYASPLLTLPEINLATSAFNTFLWLISNIGGIIAALVPCWVFTYRTKKRSVDLYYSLPVSHKKILTVKFLVGLIAVFAAYTVAYWVGALILIARVPEKLYTVYYLPQYFASLFPVYVIYAISSFVFTRANRRIDGIIFVLFWAFAVMLLVAVLEELVEYSVVEHLPEPDEYGRADVFVYKNHFMIFPDYFLPFKPLDWVTEHFQNHLVKATAEVHTGYNVNPLINLIVGFTLTGLQAIAATVGLFLLEDKTKAENAGQVSDSWFGYKFMIPFYTVALIGFTVPLSSLSFILVALILVGAFVLSALYRQKLLIGKRQAIILAASIAAGWLLAYFCNL